MRKSIAIAAALVASAGATAVGASSVPTSYFGSDTLFVVTQDALTNASISSPSFYLAGGSGAGQGAMAAATLKTATQQTAPMSKMMTNGVCNALGGTNGNAATGANGIVIGMDGVDVLASVLSGGLSACTTAGSGAAQSGDGLVYSGTTGVFSAGSTGQNWKWALALLYGGLDLSTPSTLADCGSTARKSLVNNWTNLFQTGATCTTAAKTANGGVCNDTIHKNAGDGTNMPLWHAFRRDDASGTSDVFSAVLGLQSQFPSPSGSSNNGYGASPYCNAINWDVNSANGTTCAQGMDDQFVGPGGVPDTNASCTFLGFNSSAAEVCTGGGLNHRQPPPGTFGLVPNSTASSNSNWDVLPTSFQDNDPIRRPCLATATGDYFTPGEEVCNLDGKLGIVLAIPSSDFIPTNINGPAGQLQYPTVACNTFLTGTPPKILNCAPHGTGTHFGECPNGDANIASTCPVAVATNGVNTSQCLSTKASVATFTSGTRTLGNPDGRVYNLHMHDGSMSDGSIAYVKETIQNGKATPPVVDFVGGMGRIHTYETVWAASIGSPPNAPCQMTDATDQVNCLVQADPCSFGYAGDGGKTWYTRTNGLPTATVCSAMSAAGVSPMPPACNASGALVSDSIRVDQTYPDETTVTALGTQAIEYQIARKLYFNSLIGFNNLTAGQTGVTDTALGGELALAQYEATSPTTHINPILTSIGYFPMGNQTTLTAAATAAGESVATFNAPFCEDFNEQTVCNPTGASPSTLAANANGCTANSGVSLPTAGSTCGNGIQEPYEECDDALNNGTTGDKCSTTCRCAGTKSYESVGGGAFQCQ